MNSKILVIAILACLAQSGLMAPADVTTKGPVIVTKTPITRAPTTKAPVTQAPTKAPTHAPTTRAPTHAPVTHAPTTKAPVTHAPTKAPTHAPTKAPVTYAPTTKAPVTQAPTTKAPVTQAPTKAPTHAPTTRAPTHAPVTHAPTTKAPVTHAPTTKAPTHAPTTHAPTHAPTTTKPPMHFPDDPKLKALEKTSGELTDEVRKVDKSFELNSALGNTIELTHLLDTIKELKGKLQSTEIDIRMEIASSTDILQTYGRRLILEFLRIQVESQSRFLTTVGETILGSFSELNKFPDYQTSETIGISLQLLSGKVATFWHSLLEIDSLIAQEQKGNGKISQAAKQKIDQDLQAIQQTSNSAKSQVASEFYNEIERLRLENKELNLYQRFEFEYIIDAFNFLSAYTRKFEDLFNRINWQ